MPRTSLTRWIGIVGLLATRAIASAESAYTVIDHELTRVDLITGETTAIGGLSSAVDTLAFAADHELWGLRPLSSPTDPGSPLRYALLTIDRRSAAETTVREDLMLQPPVTGMAFDACDRLWVSAGQILHQVDPATGAAREIGRHGGSLEDLAAGGEQLYGVLDGQVVSIDSATGAPRSLVGTLGAAHRAVAIDSREEGRLVGRALPGLFDSPMDGVNVLFELDLASGQVTLGAETEGASELVVGPAPGDCTGCLVGQAATAFSSVFGELHSLDLTSGRSLPIGMLSDASATAFSPAGFLYAVFAFQFPGVPLPFPNFDLATVDLETGEPTFVMDLQMEASDVQAMTFDAAGSLWLTTGETLYSVDLVEGRADPVGDHGVFVFDLAAAGDTLYGQTERELVTIDPATGLATPTGLVPPDDVVNPVAIAFDSRGTLWGLGWDPFCCLITFPPVGRLYQMDLDTGEFRLGPTTIPGTSLDIPPHAPDPGTLCLRGGAFKVEVGWTNRRDGRSGLGVAIPHSPETGFFWFFDPENVELAVKVLDGRPVNDHFWVFYGGLSDVEYRVVVTDLEKGVVRPFDNRQGEICGQADTQAFKKTAYRPTANDLRRLLSISAQPRATANGAPCAVGPESLCLLQNRFLVEVEWINQHDGGSRGVGSGIPLTGESGVFWFFEPDNVELVVKVLDGRPVNGHFWVFYGSLTDVEFFLTATDTVTGASNTYHNPPGNICGRGDTGAF